MSTIIHIMKIVHISVYPAKDSFNSPDQSGVAYYTHCLVNELERQGYNNVVLCEKMNKVSSQYMENNISVMRCFDRKPGFVFQILRQINAMPNIDIVHIQQEKSLYGSLLTAYLLQFLILWLKIRGIKVVTTIHGLVSYQKINTQFLTQNGAKNMPAWLGKIGFFLIYQPLFWFSHKIIVHTKSLLETAKKDYHGNSKVYMIPIGIELLKTSDLAESKKKLGLDTTKKTILFFGFTNGYKGLDLLIEGFSEYSKQNSDAQLYIASGPSPNLIHDQGYMTNTYHRLREKAEDMIDAKHYKWPYGSIKESDIQTIYSAADVVIFPYTVMLAGSGPLSIAMSYSKPYLVSQPLSEFTIKAELVFDLNSKSVSDTFFAFFSNHQNHTIKFNEFKESVSWMSLVKNQYRAIYKNL